MDFWTRLYERSFTSERNPWLTMTALLCTGLTILVLCLFFSMRFSEVFKGNGLVIAARKSTLSNRRPAVLAENFIETGRRYRKGEALLTLYFPEADRQERPDDGYFETVMAPFDCVLLASPLAHMHSGSVAAGAVIAQLEATDDLVAEVPITGRWVSRIHPGDKAEVHIVGDFHKEPSQVRRLRVEQKDQRYIYVAEIDLPQHGRFLPGLPVESAIVVRRSTILDFFRYALEN